MKYMYRYSTSLNPREDSYDRHNYTEYHNGTQEENVQAAATRLTETKRKTLVAVVGIK